MEDEDQEHIGDDTRGTTEMYKETPINNTANDMVQDTETAPWDYIAQIEEEEKEDDFEPHTSQGDLQHGNAIIMNIEDPKSKSVYENTTVDDNINATNYKNPEAVADNISARKHFDGRSGIKTSHYTWGPEKKGITIISIPC